jgi:hypothetical protein
MHSTNSLNKRFEAVSISREPSSNAMKLLKRWASFTEAVSEGYDTRYVFTRWMRSIPQRLGHSNTIDLAVDCFLKSIVAYVNQTSENLNATDASYAKTLRNIRVAFVDGDSDVLHADVFLAICLIYHVEVRTHQS